MTTAQPSAQQLSDQSRAARAWQDIKAVQVEDQAGYGSLARRLPALIQVNGLAQTLAFLCSKPDKVHFKLVYNNLDRWVGAFVNPGGERDLLEWIVTQNSAQYRRATAEALAFSLWLRRFAEAQGWSSQEVD